MDDIKDFPKPLFGGDDEPGPRFKPSEAAALIAMPGMDAEKVAPQVRAIIRAGHVQTRGYVGRGAKNPHALLAGSDVAVASVLVGGLLHDLGFTLADPRVFVEVSAAMYAWPAGDARRSKWHPINHALVGVAERDEMWMLRLDVYRKPIGGEPIYRASMYDIAKPAPRGVDAMIPRSTISINLASHLIPIVEAIRRKTGAN